MLRHFSCVLVLAATAVPSNGFGAEATTQDHLAAVDVSQVDFDFQFQGEYIGSVFTGELQRGWETVGLQVIAGGKAQFNAVLYPGGLPGSGWRGGEKVHLSGVRTADVLSLHGSGRSIVIENGAALFYQRDGQLLGQIARIDRASPTAGMPAPWGANVLFDGYGTEALDGGRMTHQGLLMEGSQFKQPYADYTLHVEFRLPYMATARGQGRSNSGVYLQSRYEVQILDSFGLEGEHNECGGLYKYREPDINMCLPPLSWQTYDIVFRNPRFDVAGNKLENARLTVYHNGVAIHNNIQVSRKTGGGAQEGPNLLPTKLQDHHNPVRFRNIWIIDDTKPTGSPYSHYASHSGGFQLFSASLPPAPAAYWQR